MTRPGILEQSAAPALPFRDKIPPLPPIRADEDRLFKITVCTRPFRAQGPRIEAEKVGDKLVVHNYGHGGSGWSLSWGSGEIALDLAFAGREPSQTDIAVIGCGALGLTSAILAQRAGARSVTIYAKDRPSESRSFRATGSWTPDSRVALTKDAPVSFAAQWEQMARTSWHYYQSFLGLPGSPIEFNPRSPSSRSSTPTPSASPATWTASETSTRTSRISPPAAIPSPPNGLAAAPTCSSTSPATSTSSGKTSSSTAARS
jgi:hypothetical protein